MKTITIAHQKGGVGKSTLALNLAYAFADSATVAITDTDVQGSINSLKSLVKGIDVVSTEGVLAKKLKGYDVVMIDTPPYLTNRLADIFNVSDYVLIPTKTGVFDVMAIRATIELVKLAMAKRPELRAGIVLNMVMPRTSLTAEVIDALVEYEIPVLPTHIHQRVSYVRSPLTKGIFGSTDNKAKEEITNLATDIYTQLR